MKSYCPAHREVGKHVEHDTMWPRGEVFSAIGAPMQHLLEEAQHMMESTEEAQHMMAQGSLLRRPST